MKGKEEENREEVSEILNRHPIHFHFDSQEKDFPIDERQNNIEFLMRKYNYLENNASTSADKEFVQIMDGFRDKFSNKIKLNGGRFCGLEDLADLDAMNLYVHNHSLKNLLENGPKYLRNLLEVEENAIEKGKIQEKLNKLNSLKFNLKVEFGDKEIEEFDKQDLRKIYESGLKFGIEDIDLGHHHLTPRNLQSCKDLHDKISQGDDCGVPIVRNLEHKPPLYYNLQKSEDGKKFVMQFGLTYPVNEGVKFPALVAPIVALFVKVAKRVSPKLYNQIKGTENGKIGYHLEDRELGHYEGHINNDKFIVDRVMLTGHGPKACEVQEMGDRKQTDVYVGVGGHPNYFHNTGKSNILRNLEQVPILGLLPMIKRFTKDHGDFCDGNNAQVLKFDGTKKDQLRDWAGDSTLRGHIASGSPGSLPEQRLFFHSFDDFEQKMKIPSKIKVTTKLKHHVFQHTPWFNKEEDIPKLYQNSGAVAKVVDCTKLSEQSKREPEIKKENTGPLKMKTEERRKPNARDREKDRKHERNGYGISK